MKQTINPMGFTLSKLVINYKVAVVTPSIKYFQQWVKDNQSGYPENTEFSLVANMWHVRGREFNQVVKAYKYYEVDSEVYDRALQRLRKDVGLEEYREKYVSQYKVEIVNNEEADERLLKGEWDVQKKE